MKKMVNDKVIRAMAIGISAVLATAQPMTAFAEEIAPEDEKDPVVEEQPSKEDDAKENREAAEKAVETADKAVDEVVNSADPIKEAAENLKESINSFNGDGNQTVKDAKELAENAVAADKAMEAATEQLNEAIKQSETAIENESKADKASEAVETATREVNEAVNAASDKVASYENEIDSANSIDVANQAYNNIVEEVAKANEEVEAAKAEYDRLVKEYNDAVVAISEAQAAYEAAKNAGLEDLNQVTLKLDEAKNNAKAVMEDVRPAKEAAKEAELRAIAKAEVINAIAAQKETAAKANNNWRELDKLADLMIKYSLLDNSEVDADSIVLSKWTSDLKDDNCVMATYKLKGSDEVITEFYDYVARNTKGNDLATDYGTYDHIEVVKKTPAYGSANGSKLVVSTNEDGKTTYKLNGNDLTDDQSVEVAENGNIVITSKVEDGVDVLFKNGDSKFEKVEKNKKTEYYVDGKKLNENNNVKYNVTGNDEIGYTVIKSEKTQVDFHYEFEGSGLIVTVDENGNLKSIARPEQLFDNWVTWRNLTKVSDTEYTIQVFGAGTLSYRTYTLYATDRTKKVDTWVDTTTTYGKVEETKYKDVSETFTAGAFAGKGEYFGLNESIANFDANSVSEATNKYNSIDKLLNDAEQETLKVEAAEDAVEKIKEKIKALESGEYEVDDAEYAGLLISYQSRLNAAKTNLANAKDNLDKLNDEVEKAKANLAATIARLTPAPVRRNNNNNRVPVVQEATPALDFVYAPGVAVAAAPMQMVAGGQGIQVAQVGGNADQADGDFLELEDVQAPLADFAEEEGVNAITLQDEETPLVSFEQEDAKRVMSWWWLLVVAVMGTTGYEMYKKHEEKKKAAETAKKNK